MGRRVFRMRSFRLRRVRVLRMCLLMLIRLRMMMCLRCLRRCSSSCSLRDSISVFVFLCCVRVYVWLLRLIVFFCVVLLFIVFCSCLLIRRRMRVRVRMCSSYCYSLYSRSCVFLMCPHRVSCCLLFMCIVLHVRVCVCFSMCLRCCRDLISSIAMC